MWAEVRIPWVLLFLIAVSAGCKQYETYGYVSAVSIVKVLSMSVPVLKFKLIPEFGLYDPRNWIIYQRMVSFSSSG